MLGSENYLPNNPATRLVVFSTSVDCPVERSHQARSRGIFQAPSSGYLWAPQPAGPVETRVTFPICQ